MAANPCAKVRPASDPYEIWKWAGWTWKVLHKYQPPEIEAENPHARWLCHISSVMNPEGYIGDVSVQTIRATSAVRVYPQGE